MAVFESLHLWNDPLPRSAGMNMAVDEILFQNLAEADTETSAIPFIRFYSWSQPSVSFGYFETIEQAKHSFPDSELQYMRRWTGGGIVDHRSDLTYTIGIPKAHKMAQLKGAESYHIIHQCVAKSLVQIGIKCTLVGLNEKHNTENSACFKSPVPFDIIDENKTKLAGAGQKRTRLGMLHQGSVKGISDADKDTWQEFFIKNLSSNAVPFQPNIMSLEKAITLAAQKYDTPHWLKK